MGVWVHAITAASSIVPSWAIHHSTADNPEQNKEEDDQSPNVAGTVTGFRRR
jgi:hypothetical protein